MLLDEALQLSEYLTADRSSRLRRIGRALATGGLSLIFEKENRTQTGIDLISSDDQWTDSDSVEAVEANLTSE